MRSCTDGFVRSDGLLTAWESGEGLKRVTNVRELTEEK